MLSIRRLISAGSTIAAVVLLRATEAPCRAVEPAAFFSAHCGACHDAKTKSGGLDLAALNRDFAQPETFDRWVRIHDRIERGEMPPKGQPRPPAADVASLLKSLKADLIAAEAKRLGAEGRTGLRRLTRAEYENTIRDLFDMPGIALQGNLPADGSAHGFDKNSDALDLSHVNLAKYVDAAEHTLDLAIATRPEPPTVRKRRISLANAGGFVAHVLLNGDGVLLKNKKPDPDFPPAGEFRHIDEGAHERIGTFRTGSTVGLFRHEDESLSPYFIEHVTIYPGLYRVRTSLWAFQWDKGEVLPARGTEAARLSVVQLTGDGRGGQHPSYVLGYYDAPSMTSKEHEVVTWLNWNELIGFNTASLAPVANYYKKKRAMEFTGPGIAVDWLDIEGPLHKEWPPRSHKLLFADLPLAEIKGVPGAKGPRRVKVRQLGAGRNRPDPEPGLYTVQTTGDVLGDADNLLASFLPKAFRRPVEDAVRKEYVARVEERLKAGDCFETAMRWAYRAALCSPDFLYHVEPEGQLDDHALACRLSYFLWNSQPDEELTRLAAAGALSGRVEARVGQGGRGAGGQDSETSLNRRQNAPGAQSADLPAVPPSPPAPALDQQVDRLLKDPKAQRFLDDFLGQWLKLRQIAATDPDKKLYPEFSPYLQDSMVAETRAYFRELIEKNLDAGHLVKSDFAMLNEKLATHYGIPGVSGSQIRRVALPADSPRGGFLTQASILKITANGTTTSPVPRGAFVMARLLGEPPDPPPANVPAIEPDVRGAKTIREQLDKHKSDAVCASCHRKIDPPGFALESFDVIGGHRMRYRSLGEGDPAPRGAIDPFIGIGFKLGPPVDASGELPDGKAFRDIKEFQNQIAADTPRLLRNLAEQLTIYSTGRDLAFRDRDAITAIVASTQKQGGGLRTLIHEVVKSELFRTR